tara:strand:+ start:4426 stop:4647 length:222 start_codon:yes stop_codon:yes gene_type:complete
MAETGAHIVQVENAPNKNAKSIITISNITCVDPDLASDIPILAIIILPPGNVGIGSNEIQPKNINAEPALVNG